MRRLLAVIAVGTLFLAVQVYGEEISLKEKKDKVSYAIGLDVGNAMKKQSIDIDTDIFVKGLKDALSGGKKLMTDDEIRETMTAFSREMADKQKETMKKVAEKNKQEGDAFLAENKKKEGVKTLPSGLQYKVITEGTGKTPQAADTVTVNYRGTLMDGTEFDSSFKRGQPASFPVNGVIKGWTEALQLMKEGAKWQLFIPTDLAYGDKGAGGTIGPNAVLIFDVELISIKEAEKK
jgi:FKBP-type peptidyl-prolyl cis-trans isomerase FklB